MHEIGPLKVEYGSIMTPSGNMIDNMEIIIDTETGGMMKYGDVRDGYMNDYFMKLKQSHSMMGLDDSEIVMITFDRYEGILNIDAICTFVNWLINCSGNAKKELFEWPKDKILAKIETLQKIGY